MFLEYHPEYVLQIIGDGSEKRSLQEKVKNMRMTNNVKFLSYQNNVHTKIRDYAMYVSTSEREGISNSMIEAMSIGLPIICTDCHGGGARAIIENGENGILVPMDDKKAICDAMRMIADNFELSNKLSQNAEKIRFRLNIENIGNEWLKSINSF